MSKPHLSIFWSPAPASARTGALITGSCLSQVRSTSPGMLPLFSPPSGSVIWQGFLGMRVRHFHASTPFTSPNIGPIRGGSAFMTGLWTRRDGLGVGLQPGLARYQRRGIFGAAWSNTRDFVNRLRPSAVRETWRDDPWRTVVRLLFAIIFILAILRLTWGLVFSRYHYSHLPAPLAKSLRMALYFSNMRPDTNRARKHWQQALDLVRILRLDAMSDDVIGIRIRVAEWYEQIEHYDGAADELEKLRVDLSRWLERFEEEDGAGKIGNGWRGGSAGGEGQWIDGGGRRDREDGELVVIEVKADETREGLEARGVDVEMLPENLWGRRNRVLTWEARIRIKLSDIYSSEWAKDEERASENLNLGMESILKEQLRREKEGTRDGEGGWRLTSSELGASLERLAMEYEKQSRFEVALPLLLRALPLAADDGMECLAASIMSNISICFYQYPIPMPPASLADDPVLKALVASQTTPPHTPPTLEQALKVAASNWSRNSLSLAKKTLKNIPPPPPPPSLFSYLSNLPKRLFDPDPSHPDTPLSKLYGYAALIPSNEEKRAQCGVACVVARVNLAEITEDMGRLKEAEKMYQRIKSGNEVREGDERYQRERAEALRRASKGLGRVREKMKELQR